MSDANSRPRLAVISPILDDWECVPPLLQGLQSLTGLADVSVLLVDDGSSSRSAIDAGFIPTEFSAVEILELGCNLGHQRAIACGLVHVTNSGSPTVIIVLDADGEDRPEDAIILLEAHVKTSNTIVVARRRGRSEGLRFRMFYRMYQLFFRILTGRVLDFGNFVLIPCSAAERLTFMPELWNHFPSAIMRSRIPLLKIPLNRQLRFFGKSRMNFTSLVTHGLAAISTFTDAVFVRILVFASVLAALSGVLAVLVLASSEWDFGNPGSGLPTLLVIAFFGLLQAIVLLGVITFLALSTRSSASLPPRAITREYIKGVTRLR